MTRIESIISKARDTLADPNAERWSDARLLSLVSDAQQDIAIHTELLKNTVDIPLVINQAEYTMPSDTYLILRASTDETAIPISSHEKYDELARKDLLTSQHDNWERDVGYSNSYYDYKSTAWQDDTGSKIEAIITDKLNPQVIRTYPIPDDGIAENEYTFENANTVAFVGDEVFGVVTDVETTDTPDYTFDSPFGVATSFYEPSIDVESVESDYGVVTQVNETEGFIRLQYISIPAELASVDDELIVPRIWDKALRYFVIAHAYDDDYDTRNQEKSAKHLTLYERELTTAYKSSQRSHSRAANYPSTYRTAFE